MFPGFTISRLAVAFAVGIVSLILGNGSAGLAQAPAEQPQAGAAPPGTHGVPGTPPILRPEQIEKRISADERERLGLPEATWVAQHGKVHPDVRAVLRTGQMPWLRFKGWSPIGFQGTAYVAVYLRHEPKGKHASKENQAAIKQVQTRILSKLTAAEFSVVHAFKDTAAILGYVNPDGLAKVAQDADVVAIGLDDKAVPEDAPRAVGEGPFKWRGKVEAGVYNALNKSADGYVFVIVDVTRVPLGPGPFNQAYKAQKAKERKLEDRVLSTLTAEEFRVRTRGAGFWGYANAAGLAKLASHPHVDRVALDRAIRFPARFKFEKDKK